MAIEDTLARHYQAENLPAGHPVREAIAELRRLRGNAAPIGMVLHCPACGMQHVDAPEVHPVTVAGVHVDELVAWANPPHRSHLCHGCGHIWRPADVPTNGVASVRTKGKKDSPLVARVGAQR